MPKKNINNSNLNEVESSKDLTILKFSAEWCGPCQMFVPIYEEASSKYSDILFGEIDIDDEETKSIVFIIFFLFIYVKNNFIYFRHFFLHSWNVFILYSFL